MYIYLIRHPPPSGTEGLCYGRLDVAVTAQAMDEAAQAVSAQIPGERLDDARIYCSPSSRCVGLARRIASPREPVPTEDLMEMNFGHWQGLAWDAVPREQMDAWAKDVWHYRPGGGESAEMVAARWQRWVTQLPGNGSASVVAVTHAGVIRVALARSGQLDRDAALMAPIPFGSVHCLKLPSHRNVSAETFAQEDLHRGVKHE
jgi:alpha-ribazole phosphatase